jgi:hypothetical protein
MALLRLSALIGPLILASGTAAQSLAVPGGESSSLALELGLLRHGQSDAAASPLRYTGSVPAVALVYARAGARTRLEVDATFALGKLTAMTTESSYPREDVWLGRLGVSWLRRVGRLAGGRVGLLAGGQLSGHAGFRIHRYSSVDSESFADLIAPLSLAGGWEWRARPDVRVFHRLAVPLMGVVMRTPYGGLKFTPPLEAAWPGEIIGVDHALALETVLSRRIGLRAVWTFTHLRHDDPREIRLAGHLLSAAAALRWGGDR